MGCVIGTAQRMEDLGDMTTLIGGFGLNGAKPEIRGTGDAILGHPMAALAWLANHLSARGQVLRAEHIITLGSGGRGFAPRNRAIFLCCTILDASQRTSRGSRP